MQHLIPGPKGLLAPLVQDEDLIHRSKSTGAMSNNDGDTAAGTNAENCRCQGLFALGVQIGIGLVQNHKEGIAIEGTSKCNSLALAR